MKLYFGVEELSGVGKRIREMLLQKQIPVKDAAQSLGIEVSHYYRLLKGERSFTLENVIAHSVYLDVSIGYLLFGEEAEKTENEADEDTDILMEKLLRSMKILDPEKKLVQSAKLLQKVASVIADR